MIRPPALHRLLALPILLAALLMLAGCSSEAEKRYNQAIEAERHQDWEQARELYQAALALDAELAEAHINLGALALRLKQLDLAEQHSHQALQLLEHKKKSLVRGFSWEKQAGL
ncbi:MAG: tetratricopeptide repeat protein, partial [Desulfuromonas sp.]